MEWRRNRGEEVRQKNMKMNNRLHGGFVGKGMNAKAFGTVKGFRDVI
jgi:hypothetical protein